MTVITPTLWGTTTTFSRRVRRSMKTIWASTRWKAGWILPRIGSAANRYGTTATEQATDRPLTERLEEERPDVSAEPVPDRPVAATPLEELDESVDDEVTPREPVGEEDQVLVGTEIHNTGESATAIEEIAYTREQ